MASTFFGLNIASSGMATYKAGLNTTAHNISNVRTEGYTKQSTVQKAKDAISLKTSYGMMGAGSNVTDITSSRDDYYDAKYRQTSSVSGKYQVETYYLKNIEDYLYPSDRETGSITNSLNDFFTSLEQLTTSPLDTTIRAEVAGNAQTLTYYANQAAIQLQALQLEVNTEIEATIKQINSYAQELSSLTKQINTIEVYGTKANDLRDQRSLLIDKLSELVDVTVVEKAPSDGNGTNQFIVTVGGGILVDTTNYNTIQAKVVDNRANLNDADNLFELEWSYGQKFDMHSSILGGKLQGLFEVRDGNNGDYFGATLTEFDANSFTLTTDQYSTSAATDFEELNIPMKNGVIKIANVDYKYTSFDVQIASDGTYQYTFHLEEELQSGDMVRLDGIVNGDDDARKQATVGDDIAFRGIPYYMAQLNEFCRTFSAAFNQVQNTGYDYNGNFGKDLYVATNDASGQEYDMTEFTKNSSDGFYYRNGIKIVDSDAREAYEAKGYQFELIPSEDDESSEPSMYKLIDADGNFVENVYLPQEDTNIFSFSSTTQERESVSYYALTALNFGASADIVNDGKLLACSLENVEGTAGWEEAKNLDQMIALQTDNTMFKQGDPESFLNVLITATLGVDSARISGASDNADNIKHSIDNRRASYSGVDEDEEAHNLVTYQNLLNYQYQVLSIMNEVLDKLINGTAV